MRFISLVVDRLPAFGSEKKIFTSARSMRIFCLPRKTFQSSVRIVFRIIFFFC
jgi:hypothetical protein